MFFKTAYEPHESGLAEFVRYGITMILVFIGYFLGQVPFLIVVTAQITERDGTLSGSAVQDFAANVDFASIGLDSNTGLVLILLSFVLGLLALWMCIAVIHKRSLKSLITPFQNIRWSRVGFGFGVWFLMVAALEILSYFISPETYQFQLEWKTWLPLVAIALLIMPMQTSFEELLFRGYLMQGFGLAANSDSLELALGIHAANNIFGAAFVTFTGSALQTDAVFRVTEVNTTFMIPVFYVLAAVFIYLCARRYGWKDWSKIYGPVRSRWNTNEDDKDDQKLEDHLVNS